MDLDGASASNAAAPLGLDTYDGSDIVLHPDVYDAGAGLTWSGYRYWMAATPYPSDIKENPSIWVSADGDTWIVYPGFTNPVVPEPVDGSYNSDPDLVMVGGTLYLIYRRVPAGDTSDDLYYRTSPDGITWSAEILFMTGAFMTLVSPALTWDGSQFTMWSWNAGASRIERRWALSLAGPWSAAEAISRLGGCAPWHLDVISTGGVFVMLITDGDQNLWLGSSDTGLSYRFASQAILNPSAAGWDNSKLYRGCLLRTATGFDMFYSGRNGAGWKIGRTAITM